ncbi:MAG TPA: hypothetical protein VKY74_21150 [Chloroflexia bacterium]|nr:hypothetical protein [Chloroflexia bacterium]
MKALHWKREHSSLVLGVLIAGVLLGVWQAGPLAAARQVARAPAGLHLSRYQAAGGLAPAGQAGPAALAPPAAGPPADPTRVVGPPTLSAALIDDILAEYGSPAQGQGATFYQMGLKYGIDPAFALGFYVYESHCGTQGVARFTRGIGNIRWTPGFASYAGYRAYPTYAAGIEDWFKLIRELYVDSWGLHTVAEIVPRYAPPADNNDPPTYVATVESLVAAWRARCTAC